MKRYYLILAVRSAALLILIFTCIKYFARSQGVSTNKQNDLILQTKAPKNHNSRNTNILKNEVKLKKGPAESEYRATARVSPARVKDSVLVRPSSYKVLLKIEVIDSKGKVYKHLRVKPTLVDGTKLNLSDLANGTYFVRVTYKNDNVKDLVKIVKE